MAYTDIAPRLAFWQGADELKARARVTGARILLGAGLSPGISNMMARGLADRLGGVERIQTAILLSLGDEYGPDSLHHVLDALVQPYSVFVRPSGTPRLNPPRRTNCAGSRRERGVEQPLARDASSRSAPAELSRNRPT